MIGEPQIALLESLAQSAWPALKTLMIDGWWLRMAEGYTKRANSVTPLNDGIMDLDHKLGICERTYAMHDLPTIFKVTSAHEELDAELALRGYEKLDLSSVQMVELASFLHFYDTDVRLYGGPTEEWLNAFCRFGKVRYSKKPLIEDMFASMPGPAAFALLKEGRTVVAVGMAVAIMDHLVLFDICTHPEHRRKGYARRVVSTLLRWGQEGGTVLALLQVVADNEPAIQLYEDFGFTEQYRYWYRRRNVKL